MKELNNNQIIALTEQLESAMCRPTDCRTNENRTAFKASIERFDTADGDMLRLQGYAYVIELRNLYDVQPTMEIKIWIQ